MLLHSHLLIINRNKINILSNRRVHDFFPLFIFVCFGSEKISGKLLLRGGFFMCAEWSESNTVLWHGKCRKLHRRSTFQLVTQLGIKFKARPQIHKHILVALFQSLLSINFHISLSFCPFKNLN